MTKSLFFSVNLELQSYKYSRHSSGRSTDLRTRKSLNNIIFYLFEFKKPLKNTWNSQPLPICNSLVRRRASKATEKGKGSCQITYTNGISTHFYLFSSANNKKKRIRIKKKHELFWIRGMFEIGLRYRFQRFRMMRKKEIVGWRIVSYGTSKKGISSRISSGCCSAADEMNARRAGPHFGMITSITKKSLHELWNFLAPQLQTRIETQKA